MVAPVQVVPSVLAADFARLGEEVAALEAAGADRIHWDLMDGHFVPNLSMGPDVVAANRPHTTLPFEAHLMVEEPDYLFARLVEAGCDRLIVHAEAVRHLHRALALVAAAGATAGVALNPATPVAAVRHVLDLVDLVLVMTINPGFGGQEYLPSLEAKVAEVVEVVEASGRPVLIEVDGGIGPATVTGAVRAGATMLVAGSAVFRDAGGVSHAVAELRRVAEAARAAS